MRTLNRIALSAILMNLPSLASAATVVEVSEGVFEGTSTVQTTREDGEDVCWEAEKDAVAAAKMECSLRYGLSSEACHELATQKVAYGPLERPVPNNNGRPFISYCTAKATVLATSVIRVPAPKKNEAYIGTPTQGCPTSSYSRLAQISTAGVQVGAFCKPVSNGYQQLTIQVNIAPHVKASPAGTVPVGNLEFTEMGYCQQFSTIYKNIVQPDGGFWFGGECKKSGGAFSKKALWEALLFVRQ
jgi:hypothetical protein